MIVDLSTRDIPGPFIKRALEIYREHKLYEDGIIVEIGCMRQELTHDPTDGSVCHSCSDGHSTAWLAASGFLYESVDINQGHCDVSLSSRRKYYSTVDRGRSLWRDGIDFLKKYDENISFLILDAWDANLPDTAEKHDEALIAAWPNLADKSLILVDDTDVEYDGFLSFGEKTDVYKKPADGHYGSKGRLAIPYALNNGYKEIFTGRMTLLSRGI